MGITPPPPPPHTTQSRTDSLTLRGGRLRKTSRGVLTFAPALAATASAIALGALLSLAPTHSAHAQSCTRTSTADTTTDNCTGAHTSPVDRNGESGKMLVVTTGDDFSVTTGTSSAVQLYGSSGVTGIDATFSGGTLTTTLAGPPAGNGIDVDHFGTGNVRIVANNAINASGDGINLATDIRSTAESMSITANGTIMAGTQGIQARFVSTVTGMLSVTASGNITSSNEEGIFTLTSATTSGQSITSSGIIMASKEGINATHNGSGDITITASGDITSTTEEGIAATTTSAGTAMTINVNANVTGGSGSKAAIATNHQGSGDLAIIIAAGATVSGTQGIDPMRGSGGANLVDVAGSVSSTTGADGVAILMRGGDEQVLRLRPGASFTGSVATDALSGRLELDDPASGNTAGTLDFTSITLTGFDTLVKNGSGTWNLTGAQETTQGATSEVFDSASVMAGTLRLNAIDFMTGSMTVAADAILEIIGDVTLATALTNTGNISLATGDDVAINTLTINGDFTAGGSVTLDVDLTGAQPEADQLVVSSSSMVTANDTAIRLRVASTEARELTEEELASVTLVTGATGVTFAVAETDACITAGGDFECEFTIAEDGTLTALSVTMPSAPGAASASAAQAALVESYAASLADITALSGLASRTANRHYANGNERGFWAQIAAGQTDTTPSFSSTGSSRDTALTRIRFGLDAPLPLADLPLENFTLGGDFWLAQTDSDITSRNGKGDIETDAFGFAASATLEHSLNIGGAGGGGNAAEGGSAPRKNGALYADAQLQHATFSSDLKAEGESVQSNHDATSWSAALELGYKLPPALHGISFTPQAQLLWSSVDFDAFAPSNANDTRISLADGETLTARLGIAAETALAALDGATLQASADVLLPLDGETSANLSVRGDDTKVRTDLQDPTLSLTAGGIFSLNATTSLAAELATTQGDEVEEYRATVSAHFAF